MARKLNTLSGRMVAVLLLIHAVLLPALYYGVLAIVERSQKDAFVDDIRIQSRFLADFLESGEVLESDAELVRHLDSVILSGTGHYAELLSEDQQLISSLVDPEDKNTFREDFEFGEHADDIYFVSVPIAVENWAGVLRVGFDEAPTLINIANIRRNVALVLSGYFLVTLFLVLALGPMLARPIHRLQLVSRKIASGDYETKLQDKSDLLEIQELATDLESMRSTLVGVNARLQEVIDEREVAQAEQKSLEARLRHAQRLESIGTLAGGIAHEFNNVLAPIVLYTELALEDLGEDPPVRAKLERVRSLASRAKGLTQQILTFGSHATDEERVAVDIAPVVEESLSMVRALVPATIDVRADIKHNIGLVLCDAVQIQQLVINLCSNAFRAFSRGGGCIQIDVDRTLVGPSLAAQYPKLREGDYVALSVSDTGDGMDAETIERIFEPFYTTQDVGKGTGLGLSVVHGIVDKYDGDIIVSSILGQGSTFRVLLPLAGRQSDNNQAEKTGS